MKRIISLSIFLLMTIFTFSQENLNIDISYNPTDERLYVELKNTGWERINFSNGTRAIAEYNGCVLCVGNGKESNSLSDSFPLLEYDESTKTTKPFVPGFWIEPHAKKVFSIIIGDKEQYKQAKILFVKVRLSIFTGKGFEFKDFIKQIHIQR